MILIVQDVTIRDILLTPATKHSINTFSDREIALLEKMYKVLYSFLKEGLACNNIILPSYFIKLTILHVNSFLRSTNNYILASTVYNNVEPVTIFSNPALCPTKII